MSDNTEQTMYSNNPFDFFKQAWGQLNALTPPFLPSLNLAEIDKKLEELKAVEAWVKMNLNYLEMSIQTLELQKKTLSTLQGQDTASPSQSNQTG